jgi:hypothetical protein
MGLLLMRPDNRNKYHQASITVLVHQFEFELFYTSTACRIVPSDCSTAVAVLSGSSIRAYRLITLLQLQVELILLFLFY